MGDRMGQIRGRALCITSRRGLRGGKEARCVRGLFRLVVSELYGIGLARLSIMIRIGRMGLVSGQVFFLVCILSFGLMVVGCFIRIKEAPRLLK